MYFKFKIGKNGLKFMGQVNSIEDGQNIICITQEELKRINPTSIVNYSKLQKVI